MNEGESLCARCAAQQKTCCQCRDVYVTLHDVQRIGSLAGRVDFWEFRVPQNPDYLDVATPALVERSSADFPSRAEQQPNAIGTPWAGRLLPALEALAVGLSFTPLGTTSGASSQLVESAPGLLLPEQPSSRPSAGPGRRRRHGRQLYEEVRQNPVAGGHGRLLPESRGRCHKPALLAMHPAP